MADRYIGRLWSRLGGDGVGAVLGRGAATSLVIRSAGALLGFAVNLLLARLLGVTQYGIYVYALSWINIVLVVALLGLPTALIRFVAAYRARQETALLRGLLRRSFQIVVLSSAILSGIGAFVVWALNIEARAGGTRTFLLAFGLLPALALLQLSAGALRGLKRIFWAQFPSEILRRLLIIVLLGATFLLLGAPLRSYQAMGLTIAAAFAVFALSAAVLWRSHREAGTGTALEAQSSGYRPEYATRTWVTAALPLLLISGTALLLNRTDIVMIGALRDPDAVGIYNAGARIAQLALFGLSAVNMIAAPMIAELYHTGRRRELQHMVSLAAIGILVFTVGAALTLAMSGRWLLGLFGARFSAAYIPLVILLGGLTVNAMCGSVGYLLTMSGFERYAGVILVTCASLNVVLNLLLIPRFGIAGAAVATSVAMATKNLSMLIVVRSKLAVDPTIVSFFRNR